MNEVLGTGLRSLELVPRLSNKELDTLIKGAKFLVWPCCGYHETLGLVAIEAFAAGIPVICSDVGVATELVAHGEVGLRYRLDDSAHLARRQSRHICATRPNSKPLFVGQRVSNTRISTRRRGITRCFSTSTNA